MKRRRGPTPAAVWEPLTRRAGFEDDARARASFEKYGLELPEEFWGSALYSVVVRYTRVGGKKKPRSDLLWLSIHRRDRKPIRDWRHLQAIKNDVAGPERVALEVYPAESNLVDTSNEYHLWVMPVGFELPFGFSPGGLLMDTAEVAAANEADGGTAATQRPWQPGLTTGPGAR